MPALALGEDGMVPPLEASPTMTDLPMPGPDDLQPVAQPGPDAPFQNPDDGADEGTAASRVPGDLEPTLEVNLEDRASEETQIMDMGQMSGAAAVLDEAVAEVSTGVAPAGEVDTVAAGAAALDEVTETLVESIPVGAETSQQPTDSSQPPAEASQPPAEASQPPAEASQPPAEASQPPAEASQPPAEASQPPDGASDFPAELAEEPGEPVEASAPEVTSTIKGADDAPSRTAAEVLADREAKKAAEAAEKKGNLFSEGGKGLLVVFLSGITLGGAGILTFKEMEMSSMQTEWEHERRISAEWKRVVEKATAHDQEFRLRATRLRVQGAGRELDVKTGQQASQQGFSGVYQAEITGKDGTRYRAYWGRLTNGRVNQVDAVRVMMEWVAPLKRGGAIQVEDRRGQANSIAFGRCPAEDLKCLHRAPVIDIGNLAKAESVKDAKAFMEAMGRGVGVSTIVAAGGTIPFFFFEVADGKGAVEDSWMEIKLIEEAMPDRRYGRTKARKGKGKKRRRRMKSRRRRRGP